MTMTTPKSTQQFLDETDWPMLRTQKLSLVTAINYAEFLNRPKVMADLKKLLDWLDCLQVAAENEGYPTFKGRVKP